MLEIKGLSHAFDRTLPVLTDIELTVSAGEFVSVLGPSGCGKSTLLRVVAGLLQPDRGQVTLEGKSLIDRPGSVAYMPQRDLLLPWRRAIDNAVLAADVRGGDPRGHRREAAALFELFGLGGFEQAWPGELSGGMRQRLALLRTYLFGGDLLLLDEPFGALDAMTRRDMHTWLQDVWMADRKSVLFVTHDIDEAITLSDRVVVMSARPGSVRAVRKVSAPRPRQSTAEVADWFVRCKATLLADLDAARHG